jgi:hypothetical protein
MGECDRALIEYWAKHWGLRSSELELAVTAWRAMASGGVED